MFQDQVATHDPHTRGFADLRETAITLYGSDGYAVAVNAPNQYELHRVYGCGFLSQGSAIGGWMDLLQIPQTTFADSRQHILVSFEANVNIIMGDNPKVPFAPYFITLYRDAPIGDGGPVNIYDLSQCHITPISLSTETAYDTGIALSAVGKRSVKPVAQYEFVYAGIVWLGDTKSLSALRGAVSLRAYMDEIITLQPTK